MWGKTLSRENLNVRMENGKKEKEKEKKIQQIWSLKIFYNAWRRRNLCTLLLALTTGFGCHSPPIPITSHFPLSPAAAGYKKVMVYNFWNYWIVFYNCLHTVVEILETSIRKNIKTRKFTSIGQNIYSWKKLDFRHILQYNLHEWIPDKLITLIT